MTTKKDYNLRYSGECLKAVSETNQAAALRFIDWKVGKDRREAGLTNDGQPVPKMDIGMKACPYCAEEIQAAAVKCRYCYETVSRTPSPRRP